MDTAVNTQKTKDSVCCIFGAADYTAGSIKPLNKHFTLRKGIDMIIAADAGYKHAEALGLEADVIIGDFDSLGTAPENAAIVKYPPEKDDTDLMLALKYAVGRGFNDFVIYGALGGRVDFTIANLQILTYLAMRGMNAYFIGAGHIMTAVTNGRLSFGEDFTGRISVLCMGETARGVTINGLKYTLSGGVLTCDVPLGVSNEFTGCAGFIEVTDGTLAVIYDDTNGKMLKE